MPVSTIGYRMMNNPIIESSLGFKDGDSYFYSLCRPQYRQKKRSCLKCYKQFLSNDASHRVCSQCTKGRRSA